MPDMRIALFEPDIPQNTGAVLRLAACMGIAVDIIEPCGFLLGERQMRRAGMDYLDHVEMVRHNSWLDFAGQNTASRRVLLTTKSDMAYDRFVFEKDDTLLIGRESAGVPDEVHNAADARIIIPMAPGLRSLNMAMAAAMALGEALRQTGALPHSPTAETA
ncbi:MAG: tRNA (cytidine(34)-2'-O)-methyltransferase [Rhodospirillales bacterium]|nr:tRNA (cytidine(34)-2'-O)-methyltransferase [Rhodospirillales bacterium]